MVNKKVAFITGTRADYGLLKPLMDRVLNDGSLEFQLMVTGMHLSPEFGYTVTLIEHDGIPITDRIEILLSGDTPSAITKSMGLAMMGFGDSLARSKPDIIVILGDRFEAFCAAAAATVALVPVAHIHGGELTEGAIDDAFRHSITKMSYLHFTSTEEYRRRVIQMGEEPSRVFNVGALGIENIKTLRLLDRDALQKELGLDLGEKIALVTFHPATLEKEAPEIQMRNLLDALDAHPELFIIFTKANADTNGRIINSMIDEYVSKKKGQAVAFSSMGQLNYLSAMKLARVVIGNSSSGIIEAPSFHVPTVNIGDRQKGRIRADTVVDCDTSAIDISAAIDKVLSSYFQKDLGVISNPCEQVDTSKSILDIIKNNLTSNIICKIFFGEKNNEKNNSSI